jgi:hypothetical protein
MQLVGAGLVDLADYSTGGGVDDRFRAALALDHVSIDE